MDVEALLDLGTWPLHRPGSDGYRSMLADVRAALDEDGCAVLPGLVNATGIAQLEAEAERVAPAAHRSFNRTNAYFTKDRPELPPEHPARRFYERSNAFVPADNFGADSPLRAIYDWPPFAPFVQAALRETRFYPYADPLADVIVNVVDPGGGFPWHFDTNNYTVTLCIRNGAEGGLFEYVPALRSAVDENFDGVRRVLDGSREGVRSLPLAPGDLQIFRGRHSLHRVTAVGGARSRYVGIFSFAERPDMVGSPERTSQLYGRVLPVHLERAGARADALID